MTILPPSVRIFLCTQATDMRKSFDGLMALVEQALRLNPFSGHLYVFRNRKGDRMKILYWDRDGLAIWYKRLEKGNFRFPESDAESVEVEAGTLTMMLEGVDLKSAKRRARFVPPGAPQRSAAMF